MFCIKLKPILFITLICCAVIGVIFFYGSKNETEKIILESSDKRIEFLKNIGYDTNEELCTYSTEIIPYEFNEVYTRYNELQIQQGFDLSDYKGITADIYTYEVENFENTTAVLIMYENNLIGYDIHNSILTSFLF